MTQPNQPDNAAAEAREQAAAYGSIFAGHTLKFDDETTLEIPPHPNLRMFDDDRLAAYDELMFETESYERGPDIYVPEQTVKDKAGNAMTLPAETRPGALLMPLRKKNAEGVIELVKPPHEVSVVIAAIGDEKYRELQSKRIKGRPAGARDVWRIWNEQGSQLVRRRAGDSKSDGGSGDLADVPATDSK